LKVDIVMLGLLHGKRHLIRRFVEVIHDPSWESQLVQNILDYLRFLHSSCDVKNVVALVVLPEYICAYIYNPAHKRQVTRLDSKEQWRAALVVLKVDALTTLPDFYKRVFKPFLVQ
jgi:hypothetical protein